MRLIVMRHGQSTADVEDCHEGRADFALTELGRQQAIQLADFVAEHYPLEKLYVSPLQRALETAAPLVAKLQLEPVAAEALMERDNGWLAGMDRREAKEKFPPPPQGRLYHEPLPGGETEIEFRSRVEHFWARLIAEPPAEWVGLVTHGGTINMLFRCLLNLPVNTNVYVATGDTGLHHWHVTPKYRHVLSSNFMGHL